MTTIRAVAPAESAQAVNLVATAMPTIPLFSWVLGSGIDDAELRHWFADLFLTPVIELGRVVGAFDNDRLIGLVAFRDPDDPAGAPLDDAERDRHLAMAMSVPGLAQRLAAMVTGSVVVAPADDAVNVFVAAVEPEARRGGILWDLMRPVEDHCRERDRPFYVWTGNPDFRDGWIARWGLELFSTVPLGDGEIYGLQSDRPPRRRSDA
ncbi:hypothetical protein GCM10009624_15200 [Gordonia sinesedis]